MPYKVVDYLNGSFEKIKKHVNEFCKETGANENDCEVETINKSTRFKNQTLICSKVDSVPSDYFITEDMSKNLV